MPKQRNHQHHRRRGAMRGGLQLPWVSYSDPPFVGSPTVHYPDGWTRRPFQTRKIIIFTVVVAVAFVTLVFGVALLVAAFGALSGGH